MIMHMLMPFSVLFPKYLYWQCGIMWRGGSWLISCGAHSHCQPHLLPCDHQLL
jgi:hypothetical protein